MAKVAAASAKGCFDCVVVGAGIQGSCTALHLARAGKRTLLVDQFEQGHCRGSSHGGSRIIRCAYKEPQYARLMPAAYKAWEAIEEETGVEIIVKTGLVNISTHPPHTFVEGLIATMSSLSLPYEVIDGRTLHERWPSFNYPDSTKVVVDSSAGIIKADVALQTIQDLFVSSGGEIRWNVAVQSVVPGHPVTLQTSSVELTAASVVLCLGPWAPSLLSSLDLSLPLEPLRTGVFYWPEKNKGDYSSPGHPTLIDKSDGGELFALPALEFPGLAKVCSHDGPGADPDIASIAVSEAIQENLSQYIQKYLPALESKPSKIITCFYTMTPDHNFILDKHPNHKNIVIGAGFSGTGFKLGPIVGHILSNLAMDLDAPYDISEFKIGRFL